MAYCIPIYLKYRHHTILYIQTLTVHVQYAHMNTVSSPFFKWNQKSFWKFKISNKNFSNNWPVICSDTIYPQWHQCIHRKLKKKIINLQLEQLPYVRLRNSLQNRTTLWKRLLLALFLAYLGMAILVYPKAIIVP